MDWFGTIRRTVERCGSGANELRLREALRALPYRLSVAWVKVSLGDRNFGKFNFWGQERQKADEILREVETAIRIRYGGKELDQATQSRMAKEMSGHMQKLEDLIKRLDIENLARLANREQLGEEISKTESIIADLSNEFEGYRFWLSGSDELKAARRVMDGTNMEALRDRTGKIRAMRMGLVSTASSLRTVNQKLFELQSSYHQLAVSETVRNKIFAAFATVKAQMMRDNCRSAISMVLGGGFEKELREITTRLDSKIIKAFAVFGVEPGAPFEQVKRSHRKLIFEYHTDKNKSPEAEEKSREINIAYDMIQRHFAAARQPAQPPN